MLLAILLPFLSFIVRGKILTGILCFILQITLIGWIPAAIWAAMSLNNERAEKRNKKLIQAVRENQR
jgi:TM2 domain-containing membrane protein YozV